MQLNYKIGDFSKISRISVKTLRYYHEIDLLWPSHIDDDTGYRFYDESCLNTAYRINLLKGLNFSLKEIKNILEEYSEDDDLTVLFKHKLNDTKEMIKEYQHIQKALEDMIPKEKPEGFNSTDSIIVKNIPEMLIASIRAKDQYSNVGYYLGKVAKQCARYICGNPFNLYYDNEYKEDGADMEICFPVKKHIDTPDVKTRVLKGGNFISAFHKGAYEDIGEVYKRLLDYSYKNTINIITPTREIYVKGPGIVFAGKPKRYITEVQFQIGV